MADKWDSQIISICFQLKTAYTVSLPYSQDINNRIKPQLITVTSET